MVYFTYWQWSSKFGSSLQRLPSTTLSDANYLNTNIWACIPTGIQNQRIIWPPRFLFQNSIYTKRSPSDKDFSECHGPHLETGSCHCFESSTSSVSFPHPYTSICTKVVYLPVKSSPIQQQISRGICNGWQALISRSLKSLNQTGEEPSLAQSHLVWTPPTVSFCNFALWWKFPKPLGSSSPRNGTFVIWECFMAWENCFLSWATFKLDLNCHYWMDFRLSWLVTVVIPLWWSFQAFKKDFWQ